jgi:hypothetical protein
MYLIEVLCRKVVGLIPDEVTGFINGCNGLINVRPENRDVVVQSGHDH